jgi:hypothetical protein
MVKLPAPSHSVITVGGGRGFVVAGKYSPLVITAAHCLPHFPVCGAQQSGLKEHTYPRLLGPIRKEPAVWAELLFADPVGDIAVMGSPDNQLLWDEAEAYEALTEPLLPMRIGDLQSGPAWLLSLKGKWFRCRVQHHGGQIEILDTAQDIVGGMSGSPIVADDGAAIGVVCTGNGPNARLAYNLPVWVLGQSTTTKTLKPTQVRRDQR